MIIGQNKLSNEVARILDIFVQSNCQIRPHFFLTGPSGSGKTHIIKTLCTQKKIQFLSVNGAQLTKEGTSGNSVSKALSPMLNNNGQPTVIFVDEFDKLFISGNTNSDLAHESTNGVQNEFLTILEDSSASVFGDYGKYLSVSVKNCLFVFAGAFNGEDNITSKRLKELGLKTEFLGRVALVYNTKPLKLEDIFTILEESTLLDSYLKLFVKNKNEVLPVLKEQIREAFEENTIGARVINNIIHKYFIEGKKEEEPEDNGFKGTLKF